MGPHMRQAFLETPSTAMWRETKVEVVVVVVVVGRRGVCVVGPATTAVERTESGTWKRQKGTS
jgi:hypothetical protein